MFKFKWNHLGKLGNIPKYDNVENGTTEGKTEAKTK